ncbi:MAG: hypothetical protein R2734_10885 [Nocardioides sp.]
MTRSSHDAPVVAARPRLRDLDPRVWRVLLGFAFSAVGSGLTLPFLYVYLVHMRGFETATVGWIFAWMGLLGFLVSPAGEPSSTAWGRAR